MALLITYHKVTQIVALCSLPDRYFKLHSGCLPNGLVSFLPLGTIHRPVNGSCGCHFGSTNEHLLPESGIAFISVWCRKNTGFHVKSLDWAPSRHKKTNA
jgi:hypothetical protein